MGAKEVRIGGTDLTINTELGWRSAFSAAIKDLFPVAASAAEVPLGLKPLPSAHLYRRPGRPARPKIRCNIEFFRSPAETFSGHCGTARLEAAPFKTWQNEKQVPRFARNDKT